MLIFIVVLLCSLISGTYLTYLLNLKLFPSERLLYGFVIALSVTIQIIYAFTIQSGFSGTGVFIISGISVIIALICCYGLYRKRIIILNELRESKVNINKKNLFYFSLIFVFWLVIFILIFEKNLYLSPEGHLRTNSPVDMPVHLAFITSFIWGDNFPPENPLYAGHPMVYPILSDYFSAFLIYSGMSLTSALILPSIIMSMVIAFLIYLFTWYITKNKLAASLSPFLLFFSGGLGFWKLFDKDLPGANYELFKGVINSSNVYTDLVDYNFQWFNFITGYLIPQRSFLFGIPLGLITIIFIWRGLQNRSQKTSMQLEIDFNKKDNASLKNNKPDFIFAGIAAGLLPLFHYHAFLAIAIITAILSIIFIQKQKAYFVNWGIFVGIVLILAIPQVLPLIPKVTGSERTVFKFYFGWMANDRNYIWFWVKNTGFLIILIAEAMFSKITDRKIKLFYIPFIFLFISANLIAYASWIGDNAKILLFWYIGSIPLVTLVLANLIRNFRVTGIIIFITLILSGALDVSKNAFSDIRTFQTWSHDDIRFANFLIKNTSPDAVFFIAPVHYHILFLSGRTALMGNPTNVHSHSIKIDRRENDIKVLFNSDDTELKKGILKIYNLDYAIIGKTERNMMKSPEQEKFFDDNYELVHKSSKYKLFKVR